jgi:hypothetical protein
MLFVQDAMHLLYYIRYRKNQLKVFEQLYQSVMLIFDVTLWCRCCTGQSPLKRRKVFFSWKEDLGATERGNDNCGVQCT